MCLISKQTNQQQNYKKAEYNKTYNFPKKKNQEQKQPLKHRKGYESK